MLAVYAIANQYPSAETGATDEDVDKIATGLWDGTVNLITRSKVGHVPRLLLEVIYQEGFSGAAGALDEKVKMLGPAGQTLSDDEQLAIRTPEDFIVDLTGLTQRLAELKENIEIIKLWLDQELRLKGLGTENAFGEKLAEQKR